MATAAVDSSAAADHHRNHLHSDSIPKIDLHLFSQSELLSLSLCSASSSLHHHRTDPDISTLKIDRSVFNESAGSRKQTFSRIRLAPRNNSQFSPSSSIPHQTAEQTLDDDSPQIVALLKSLFGGNSVEICNVEDNLVSVPVQYNGTVLVSESTAKKRKRGKPPVGDGDLTGKCVAYDLDRNTNARAVDLEEFGNMEDPYARELNRRTLDMQTREQLLEFLQGLDGEWLSKRKKRKIVSASTLGDLLPSGWKLLLCMKNRAGYFWIDCRRYISPNGQEFMSCKDASSYLNSSVGLQDASQLNFGAVDGNIQRTEKEPSGNAADDILDKNEGALVCSSGLPPNRSVQHEKKSMEGGIPGLAETLRKYYCHRCTMVFDEPDGLLQHFLSSHHKVPKKVRQETLNEEVIFNNGKYECQFCDKSYDERRRYYGHLGNHIKDYFKRIQPSGEATGIHRSTMPPLVAVHPGAVKIQESTAIDMGSVAISSNIQRNADLSYDIQDCTIEETITDESYCRQLDVFCSKIDDNSVESNDIVVVEDNNVQGGYSKCSHGAIGMDQICARDNIENQPGNMAKGHGRSTSTTVEVTFERVSQVCPSSSLDEKAVISDDMVNQVSATTFKESRYEDVGGSSNSVLSVGSGFNNVIMEDFATGKELESSTRTWIDQTSDAGNEMDGTYRCIVTKHGQEKKSEGGNLYGSEQCLGSENTVTRASNDTREVSNHDKVLYVRSSTDNKEADLVASHETALELESNSGNSLLVPFGNELTFSLKGNEVLNGATKFFVEDKNSDRNPHKGVKSLLEGDTHITFDCSHIGWDTGAFKSTIEESYSNDCSLVTSESLWNATEANVTGGVKKKLQIVRPKKNDAVSDFRRNTQSSETVMSDFMRKHDKESDLQRSFTDTSQVVQSPGCFTTYDLMSYKGGNELFGEKFNGISGFEGLRSGNIENMEYNFMSNHSEESKVFSDNKIARELESSPWLEKEAVPLLPETASRQHGLALCVWCKNELHHEDFEYEMQIGSLNLACAACKVKFSSSFS